jgi:hypothetical protein
MLQMFYLDVAKVNLDVAYACMLQAYVSNVSYICCKYFIWMLHMFCNGYKRVFLVFQTYVASWSKNVCCKCFNYFDVYCEYFHLDITKIDFGVAHVAVGPNCNRHLMQLLCPPVCAWVWRGCHNASAGHEACAVHGAGAGHGAAWAPTWSKHNRRGVRTLAPSKLPGARSSVKNIFHVLAPLFRCPSANLSWLLASH